MPRADRWLIRMIFGADLRGFPRNLGRTVSISMSIQRGTNSCDYSLLASVIETYRLRAANVIDLLAGAIHAARRGLPAHALPAISAA